MEIQSTLTFIGEKISEATAFLIRKLSELGINITQSQAKILNILLFLVLIWVAVKFLATTNKLVKFAIIILLVVLSLSTIFSFFT